MQFDDQMRRYFGTSDLAALTPAALAAGTEHMAVEFGLEKDRSRRFALWTLTRRTAMPRAISWKWWSGQARTSQPSPAEPLAAQLDMQMVGMRRVIVRAQHGAEAFAGAGMDGAQEGAFVWCASRPVALHGDLAAIGQDEA